MTCRILLVDDHRIVELGLRAMIASEPGLMLVGAVSTGEEAVEWVRRDPPEIVILDLRLAGGMDGIEAARQIATLAPAVRALCYTAADEEPYAYQFLQAGGKGYVTKGAPADEVLTAIARVMAGGKYVQQTIAQKMAISRVEDRGDGCRFDSLSVREFDVARRIIQGQKNHAIWSALQCTPQTLSTYRKRIYLKLGIASDIDLVHLARRCGMLDAEPVAMGRYRRV
jgi:two-component system invasion response regulator UvrY